MSSFSEWIAAAQKRCDEATEGPWRALTTGRAGGDHWYVCDENESIALIHANDGSDEDQREPDATFIAHSRADVPALLAAVEAVLTLHAPREQAVLSDPDCLREECDHDGGCPLTGSVTVCAACWDVAEDAYPYFCEEGVPDEVLHPCPTVRAIEGALS